MYKKKKRYSTLLETLIALALITILTSSLLKLYFNINRNNHKSRQHVEYTLNQQITQQRLIALMQRASLKLEPSDKNLSVKNLLHAFYISHNRNDIINSDSLVFTFDNLADINPEFSKGVLGRIFIDDKKNLVFYYWPQPNKEIPVNYNNYRREILLEGVKDICFRLYFPPNKEYLANEIDPERIYDKSSVVYPAPNRWYSSQKWIEGDIVEESEQASYQELPSMIKFHIIDSDNREIVIAAIISATNKSSAVDYYL